MVKRLNERRFDTSVVQSEGSWITLRAMTVGETIERQAATEDRANLWYRIGAWVARAMSFVLPWLKSRGGSTESKGYSLRLIAKITSWNWIDVHGDPLPQPQDDPSVVFELTNDELSELAECAYGARKSEQLKN